MTRRRNPLRTALLAYAVVAVLLAFAALAREAARLLPLLVVAGISACIWLGWHRARHQTPGPPPGPQGPTLPDLSGEVVRLQAECIRLLAANDQLRAERDDAIEAMHAAWDASSKRPPRPASPDRPASHLDRLLADPRSGVRRLTGGQP